MAFKKYGYYIKGNKIALIEQSDSTSSGRLAVAHCTISQVDGTPYTTKDTCEAAGGQWIPGSSGSTSNFTEYMSPNESVTNGLEIQYAYSPMYRIEGSDAIDSNKFFVNGWTVINGYLTFCRNEFSTTAQVNWTNAPESISDGDYIIVNGSDRWNGLHKVQINSSYPGTEGTLTTTTKVNTVFPYWEDQDIDLNASEEVFDGGGGVLWLADHFVAGDYIFISGCSSGSSEQSNGFWRIGSVSKSTTAASSKLTVDAKYVIQESDQSLTGFKTEDGYELYEEVLLQTAGTGMASVSGESDINLYKAERDFCSIRTNIDVMDDETFDLDLPRYQTNAIVYYLKAKMAEDQNNLEMREFFMREFKRQLEKGVSALKRGPYIVQGFKEMR